MDHLVDTLASPNPACLLTMAEGSSSRLFHSFCHSFSLKNNLITLSSGYAKVNLVGPPVCFFDRFVIPWRYAV